MVGMGSPVAVRIVSSFVWARGQWCVALGGSGLSGGAVNASSGHSHAHGEKLLFQSFVLAEGALPVSPSYGEGVFFQSVVCCMGEDHAIVLSCSVCLCSCHDVSRVLLAASTVRLSPAPHSVCGASRRRHCRGSPSRATRVGSDVLHAALWQILRCSGSSRCRCRLL